MIGRQPFGHWKTTTFTAGLRCDGLTAPWVLDGTMNRDAFVVYIDKVLGPTLRAGDIAVMHNLRVHKGDTVRKLIEQVARQIGAGRCAGSARSTVRRDAAAKPWSSNIIPPGRRTRPAFHWSPH